MLTFCIIIGCVCVICHEPESFLFGFSGDVCNDKGKNFSVFNFHIQNAIIACMIQFSRLLLAVH